MFSKRHCLAKKSVLNVTNSAFQTLKTVRTCGKVQPTIPVGTAVGHDDDAYACAHDAASDSAAIDDPATACNDALAPSVHDRQRRHRIHGALPAGGLLVEPSECQHGTDWPGVPREHGVRPRDFETHASPRRQRHQRDRRVSVPEQRELYCGTDGLADDVLPGLVLWSRMLHVLWNLCRRSDGPGASPLHDCHALRGQN